MPWLTHTTPKSHEKGTFNGYDTESNSSIHVFFCQEIKSAKHFTDLQVKAIPVHRQSGITQKFLESTCFSLLTMLSLKNLTIYKLYYQKKVSLININLFFKKFYMLWWRESVHLCALATQMTISQLISSFSKSYHMIQFPQEGVTALVRTWVLFLSVNFINLFLQDDKKLRLLNKEGWGGRLKQAVLQILFLFVF